MHISIEIDDDLMREALRLTDLATEREVVELGLKTLIVLKRQAEIRKYKGKLNWEGSLDRSRGAT